MYPRRISRDNKTLWFHYLIALRQRVSLSDS